MQINFQADVFSAKSPLILRVGIKQWIASREFDFEEEDCLIGMQVRGIRTLIETKNTNLGGDDWGITSHSVLGRSWDEWRGVIPSICNSITTIGIDGIQ